MKLMSFGKKGEKMTAVVLQPNMKALLGGEEGTEMTVMASDDGMLALDKAEATLAEAVAAAAADENGTTAEALATAEAALATAEESATALETQVTALTETNTQVAAELATLKKKPVTGPVSGKSGDTTTGAEENVPGYRAEENAARDRAAARKAKKEKV